MNARWQLAMAAAIVFYTVIGVAPGGWVRLFLLAVAALALWCLADASRWRRRYETERDARAHQEAQR